MSDTRFDDIFSMIKDKVLIQMGRTGKQEAMAYIDEVRESRTRRIKALGNELDDRQLQQEADDIVEEILWRINMRRLGKMPMCDRFMWFRSYLTSRFFERLQSVDHRYTVLQILYFMSVVSVFLCIWAVVFE